MEEADCVIHTEGDTCWQNQQWEAQRCFRWEREGGEGSNKNCVKVLNWG